jgi:16S rRNA (cytosine1402-N4)-methyltransferase
LADLIVAVNGTMPAHIPVLLKEVCELLDPRPGETVVDATIGLGGHARELAGRIGANGRLIGLDVDPLNLDTARQHLVGVPCRLQLFHANFAELPQVLADLSVEGVDVLLADLGVSSTQLDDPARGFSFREDGPLDMRMDPRLNQSALDLVNRLKERQLSDLLYYNAQEMASRRIAKRICAVRREGRINTTTQLARIIADALGVDPTSRKSKIHPATRTFMALRMAVNDEIPCLERFLAAAPAVLRPGGRVGVIAFHSVEDKPVKNDFRQRKAEGIYRILTKKPIVAGFEERRANPRSRSAKLRVAQRSSEEA